MKKIVFILLLSLSSCIGIVNRRATVKVNYTDGTSDTLNIEYCSSLYIDQYNRLCDDRAASSTDGHSIAADIRSFSILQQTTIK